MNTRASGIILYVTLIGGILSLTGEGGPDRDVGGGKGLPQSQAILRDISAPAGSPGEAKVRQNLSYGNIPLYFVPNRGQVNEAARFYARASRYTLWLTAEGLVFDRSVRKEKPDDRTRPWGRGNEAALGKGIAVKGPCVAAPVVESSQGEHGADVSQRGEDLRGEGKREVHRLVFMGANPEPTIEGEGGTGHTASYFIGSDPAKWRRNIATSRAAVYRELYPNIDLKVYGVEKQIEYDWLVKPGGDPEAIDFAYQDVLGTDIDSEGNLVIRTELGEFRHRKPDAYQEDPNGTRESVEASFRRLGPDRYGFTVGSYDPARPLIIDPVVLLYSSYLGGSGFDFGHGIAVDSRGCAYVTGETASDDFPIRNPFMGDNDRYFVAFVTKFTAAGNDLIYSTYLGGDDEVDTGRAIAVDSSGCAYITGETYSRYFPTRNPFQANLHGWVDPFITKLTAAGDDLIYSTYLGGSSWDTCKQIAIDSSGCAYIAGITNSPDFPTQNAFQADYKGTSSDAFVSKLSPAGSSLVYSTYLGGTDIEDYTGGIAVDASGCAYICAITWSVDFPTRNAFQANLKGAWWDAFVTKFTAAGNDLVYSTYLGGSGKEETGGISVDASGCAYVAGLTSSVDFPTRNAFQANFRGGPVDVFVTKLIPSGNDLIYSTYLGGSQREEDRGISVDSSGCAYINGITLSDDFPFRNPFQTFLGRGDAFVAKLSVAGNDLVYSTCLGGSEFDFAHAIAVDSSGCAYVTGQTWSVDFPTRNPFQANFSGGWDDAFVTKLDMGFTVTASVSGAGGTVNPATQTVVSGESATINIYPDTGYAIASIADNGGSVAIANPYVINNVREDHDVVVTFTRVYTVTASVSGFGGSVSPVTQTVVSGGTATINIYPDLGYHIGYIRDNGVSAAIANPYVVNDVQEDHAVVVTFVNEPPTIKIINPTDGAKVYGVVSVKAEASDDLRVLKVAFLIDEQLIGEDAFAESTNLYSQAWDTRGYGAGIHRVKAVAFDEAGLTAEDAINVIVENVALILQGQRLTESAWILKKQFIRLTIGIQNLGQVSVAKYVIYRKNGTGDFKAIKEIPGSEVTGPTYVWVDKTINKNQTYTYRVLALSSSGLALGVSNDITL